MGHITVWSLWARLERRCSTCLPFSFVSHLLYLSFYNCVPDADMSINKLGAPCAPAEPNNVYVEGCKRGRASGRFSARAQVESRCVTKHQCNFKTRTMTRVRFVNSDLYYPHVQSFFVKSSRITYFCKMKCTLHHWMVPAYSEQQD